MVLSTLLLTALLTGSAPAVQTTAASAVEPPLLDQPALPGAAGERIGRVREAALRNPEDPEAVGRLAMAYHAWEQWGAAAETYRKARTLSPKDRRWWYLAGLLETARGRHADGVPLLERAAALDPGNAAGQLRLAEARLEAGDLAASEPMLRALARGPLTRAAAEYGLGRIAQAREDHPVAVTHLERAVQAFPEFGGAHYALSLSYRRLHRPADAAEALRRQQTCIPCWPAVDDPAAASIAALRDDPAAVLKRGIALAADGRTDAAVEAHEQALSDESAGAQARVNLITLYGRLGRWAEAEAQYRQALAARVNLAEAHANYAHVLLAQGRAMEAIPVLRLALEVNPADAPARNALGLALETTGETVRAAEEYRRAMTAAPRLRVARFNYGRTLVGAGRLGEAIAEFEKLRTPVDVETPRYLFALAAARVRRGDVEKGRAEAESALELAKHYGLSDLAAEIARDLARLK
jgi:tetratricopeptide (TPR) repeat protein